MKRKYLFLFLLFMCFLSCFARKERFPSDEKPLSLPTTSREELEMKSNEGNVYDQDSKVELDPDVLPPEMTQILTKSFFQEDDPLRTAEIFNIPTPPGKDIVFKKYVHTWGPLSPLSTNTPVFFVSVNDADTSIQHIEVFYKINSIEPNIPPLSSEWNKAPLHKQDSGEECFKIQLSHFNLGHSFQLSGKRKYELTLYAQDNAGNKSQERVIPFTLHNMMLELKIERGSLMSVQEGHVINDQSLKFKKLFIHEGIRGRQEDVILEKFEILHDNETSPFTYKILTQLKCFYSHEMNRVDLESFAPAIKPIGFKEESEIPCRLMIRELKNTGEENASLLESDIELSLIKDQKDKLVAEIILEKGAEIVRRGMQRDLSGVVISHKIRVCMNLSISAVSAHLEDEFQQQFDNGSKVEFKENFPLLMYEERVR